MHDYKEYLEFKREYNNQKKSNRRVKRSINNEPRDLSEKELEEILHEFQTMGFRLQITSELFETVKDIVPRAGEWINIENQNKIVIGNGKDTVENLPSIAIDDVRVNSTDLPAVQASKIWIQMHGKAFECGITFKLMPEEVLSEFIALKPENFSFMLGEDLPNTSFLKQFWDKAKDARGLFIRNRSKISNSNDPDGVGIKVGDIQDDAISHHRHKGKMQKFDYENNPPYVNHITVGDKPQLNNPIVYNKPSALYLADIGGIETRSSNIRVVFVWRIA